MDPWLVLLKRFGRADCAVAHLIGHATWLGENACRPSTEGTGFWGKTIRRAPGRDAAELLEKLTRSGRYRMVPWNGPGHRVAGAPAGPRRGRGHRTERQP